MTNKDFESTPWLACLNHVSIVFRNGLYVLSPIFFLPRFFGQRNGQGKRLNKSYKLDDGCWWVSIVI